MLINPFHTIPELLLSGQVKRLMRQGDVSSPELPICAGKLFRIYVKGETFLEKLQAFNTLNSSLLVIDYSIFGEAESKVAGAFGHMLIRKFTEEHDVQDDDMHLFTEVLAEMKRDPQFELPRNLNDVLRSHLACKRTTTLLAEGVQQCSSVFLDGHTIPLGNFVPPQPSVMRELLDAAKSCRRYGVKTCIVHEGGSSSTIIRENDAAKFRAMSGYGNYHDDISPLLAADRTSNADHFKLHPEFLHRGNSYWVKREYGTAAICTLDETGELFVGDLSNLSAKSLFLRAGPKALEYYELYRLLLCMRYFDLVVPLQVVRDARRRIDAHIGSRPDSHHALSDVAALILPRIRALEAEQHPESLLDEELENDFKETQTRTRKPIRKHDVVWQIRKLPEGYAHSPRAAQCAYEYGITLAKNETFVQSHSRGSGAEIPGHIVKMR